MEHSWSFTTWIRSWGSTQRKHSIVVIQTKTVSQAQTLKPIGLKIIPKWVHYEGLENPWFWWDVHSTFFRPFPSIRDRTQLLLITNKRLLHPNSYCWKTLVIFSRNQTKDSIKWTIHDSLMPPEPNVEENFWIEKILTFQRLCCSLLRASYMQMHRKA